MSKIATQIINRDGKEKVIRSIKEEVLGLVIDDTKSDGIGDAFGWDKEKWDNFFDTYKAFRKFQEAAENLDKDLPEGTTISNLADFLKSANFKKLGIKIEKPNDYFILGYMTMALKAWDAMPNNLPNPMDLIKLLKRLSDS